MIYGTYSNMEATKRINTSGDYLVRASKYPVCLDIDQLRFGTCLCSCYHPGMIYEQVCFTQAVRAKVIVWLSLKRPKGSHLGRMLQHRKYNFRTGVLMLDPTFQAPFDKNGVLRSIARTRGFYMGRGGYAYTDILAYLCLSNALQRDNKTPTITIL